MLMLQPTTYTSFSFVYTGSGRRVRIRNHALFFRKSCITIKSCNQNEICWNGYYHVICDANIPNHVRFFLDFPDSAPVSRIAEIPFQSLYTCMHQNLQLYTYLASDVRSLTLVFVTEKHRHNSGAHHWRHKYDKQTKIFISFSPILSNYLFFTGHFFPAMFFSVRLQLRDFFRLMHPITRAIEPMRCAINLGAH